ncbi:unknown function [Klebsiella phage vB_Kpn_K51PH129C1]|uniref:Uncharacterized protein n=1 Tax=Klebsiella phage vB_Kpn_K51PH129C1 TaxID=3071644 RepID=A0AAV1MDD5_9CAUD|nr:unknown function [Klebsiella phage vB_Kpn_K51PH129C1]
MIMHKFKVGDKVVRKEWCGEDEYFISKLGGGGVLPTT